MAFRKKLFTAVVEAADKILAAKANRDEQAETAVQLKAQGLLALQATGVADAGKRLEAMPAELEKMGRPAWPGGMKAVLLSAAHQRAGARRPRRAPRPDRRSQAVSRRASPRPTTWNW